MFMYQFEYRTNAVKLRLTNTHSQKGKLFMPNVKRLYETIGKRRSTWLCKCRSITAGFVRLRRYTTQNIDALTSWLFLCAQAHHTHRMRHASAMWCTRTPEPQIERRLPSDVWRIRGYLLARAHTNTTSDCERHSALFVCYLRLGNQLIGIVLVFRTDCRFVCCRKPM